MRSCITFRSVTFGQKAERILRRAGMECTLLRTPRDLSHRGCGYCLSLPTEQILDAARLLNAEKLDYGKLYVRNPDGHYEEIRI